MSSDTTLQALVERYLGKAIGDAFEQAQQDLLRTAGQMWVADRPPCKTSTTNARHVPSSCRTLRWKTPSLPMKSRTCGHLVRKASWKASSKPCSSALRKWPANMTPRWNTCVSARSKAEVAAVGVASGEALAGPAEKGLALAA